MSSQDIYLNIMPLNCNSFIKLTHNLEHELLCLTLVLYSPDLGTRRSNNVEESTEQYEYSDLLCSPPGRTHLTLLMMFGINISFIGLPLSGNKSFPI